jgi:formylglycine-generating enzyme required for sulfatase activity
MSVRTALITHRRQLIAFSIAGCLLAPSIAIALSVHAMQANTALPDLVRLDKGEMFYQRAGDFTQSGKGVESPRVRVSLSEPIDIMKYQVTAADFQRCVDDGTCHPLDARFGAPSADRPAVDLSWHDADDYAGWLTRKSGDIFRLPTDEEWIIAADDRINTEERHDRGQGNQAGSPSMPAYYSFSPRTFELGTFGSNRNGVFDFAGNVWEWTNTCLAQVALDSDRTIISEHTNCGVRVAEGPHRAYITDIVRDPRASGCTGIPPTHLGFRLVREQRLSEKWIANARRFLSSIPTFFSDSKSIRADVARARFSILGGTNSITTTKPLTAQPIGT